MIVQAVPRNPSVEVHPGELPLHEKLEWASISLWLAPPEDWLPAGRFLTS